MALSVVVVLMLIFTLLTSAILFMVAEHMKGANLAQKKEQDYYNCESALLYIYNTAVLTRAAMPDGEPLPPLTYKEGSLDLTQVTVIPSWSGNTLTLTARGKYGRTCVMTVTLNDDGSVGGKPGESGGSGISYPGIEEKLDEIIGSLNTIIEGAVNNPPPGNGTDIKIKPGSLTDVTDGAALTVDGGAAFTNGLSVSGNSNVYINGGASITTSMSVTDSNVYVKGGVFAPNGSAGIINSLFYIDGNAEFNTDVSVSNSIIFIKGNAVFTNNLTLGSNSVLYIDGQFTPNKLTLNNSLLIVRGAQNIGYLQIQGDNFAVIFATENEYTSPPDPYPHNSSLNGKYRPDNTLENNFFEHHLAGQQDYWNNNLTYWELNDKKLYAVKKGTPPQIDLGGGNNPGGDRNIPWG